MKEYIIRSRNDGLLINSEPVQELVRCKECMYGITSSKDYVFCSKATYFSKYKEPDWFCADGVRRE